MGLLAKGVLGHRVSLTAFCAAQVAIDCESGYYLLRAEWPFHRFAHTLAGATVVCSAVVLVGWLIGRRWPRAPNGPTSLLGWLKADVAAVSSLGGAVMTVAIAVLGHVVPDAIMHPDVRPFAPLLDNNPFHEWISLMVLHGALVVAGAVGATLVVRNVVREEKA
ncbi:MAG: hypothetical protein QM820_61055 [Minicystis sp.]